MTLMDIQALHEPYAHLYVGDYFADTLDLAAREHRALRLLRGRQIDPQSVPQVGPEERLAGSSAED